MGSAAQTFNFKPVLHDATAWTVGDKLDRSALGISFFLIVLIAEKLVVRRAPENLV